MKRMALPRWSVPLFTGLVAFAVYVSTLAPDLTWAYFSSDGPELVTAAVTLGVPHPPGYPSYVLVGHLFSRLPVGIPAFRLNMFSAAAMALAAAFTAAAAAAYLRRSASQERSVWFAAAGSGLTFAFAPPVWQQAVVTEVYALNLAVLAVLLWLLLRSASPSPSAALFTGLFAGLALTTHLTSALMIPLALSVLAPRRWPRYATGLVLGLAPLPALPMLADSGSPVIWGEPGTLAGWWWLVSGRLYHPNAFAFPLSQWGERIGSWLQPLLLFFLLAGLASLATRRSKRPFLALLLTAFLYLAYAFTYAKGDAVVLTLPAFLLLSILLANTYRVRAWLALLLPAAFLLLNLQVVDQHQHRQAREVMERALGTVPDDAILLTKGDRATFTLWYLHFVEEQRQDVTIVDEDLFAFSWYRARLKVHYPALGGTAEDNLSLLRAQNQDRPFCHLRMADADFSSARDPAVTCGKE